MDLTQLQWMNSFSSIDTKVKIVFIIYILYWKALLQYATQITNKTVIIYKKLGVKLKQLLDSTKDQPAKIHNLLILWTVQDKD